MGKTYLQMEYVQNMDQLFAIKCKTKFFDIDSEDGVQIRHCGIYDFKETEWKRFSPFIYQ